jgi:UDP-N-acetylglucosamine 2-epimerase (non-hydrolysing)
MKIVSVASARPNFVKLAAIDHAIRAANDPALDHVIVHTGQHYDPLFSDVFFEQLDIRMPAHNLGVHGGTREEAIERTHAAMVPVLEAESPDIVLVYGDVNGAVGAARAAKQLGVRLAHVEAGLRSFDNGMPEELNRIEVDGVSDVLFCSEESGVRHLEREGAKGRVHFVGNTMIDTLIRMLPRIGDAALPSGLPASYAVATVHRPSNVDDADALQSVLGFLGEASAKCPVVLPVHHRLRASMDRFNLTEILPKTVLLVEPQPYVPFLRLMRGAQFLLTDSGGIQEEAVLLRKRCFTLRRNTERPATIAVGSNILIDPAVPRDRAAVMEFAEAPGDVGVDIPQLWDGKAGERIVEILLHE